MKQNDQEEVADKDYTGPWYYYIGASRSKRLRIERDHGVKFGNQEGGIEQDQEQGGDQDQDGELGERGQDEDEQDSRPATFSSTFDPLVLLASKQ